MSAVSKKQFKWMQLISNNPEKAAEAGIKPSVAKEYVSGNVGSNAYKKLPETAIMKKPKLPKI